MAFRTKLDYSDNRQIKQRERTSTILSGSTTFGVPYSALTSGIDNSSSGTTEIINTIVASTFSGNGTTTIFTWYDPRMSLAESEFSAITNLTSGVTQESGILFTVNTTGTTQDGYDYNDTYSGLSFSFTVNAIYSGAGPVFSGTVQSDDVEFYSASSLDYTGRTIWVDNPEITRTKRFIVTDNPVVGHVLTCVNAEGEYIAQPISGITSGVTFWEEGGTGLTALKDEKGSHTLNGVSDNSIIAGGYLNTIDTSIYAGILGGRKHTIENSSDRSVIIGGLQNLITSGHTDSAIIGGSGNTIHFGTYGNGEAIMVSNDSTIMSSVTTSIIGSTLCGISGASFSHFIGSDDSSIIGVGDVDASGKNIVMGSSYIELSASTLLRRSLVLNSVTSDMLGDGENRAIINSFNAHIPSATYSSIINSIRAIIDSSQASFILGASGSSPQDTTITGSNITSIISSVNSNAYDSNYSSILGGSGNTLNNVNRSVILGGNNITATADDTVYMNNLYVTQPGEGNFYSDLDNSAGALVLLSGGTDGLIRFATTTSLSDGVAFGMRGATEASYPGYGNQGDGYVYSSINNNGLNLISAPGVGTGDYIRFYAGQDAAGTTADIHIQGTGATRGYVGIATESPTQQLDVNGNGRFRNIGSSASAGALHYDANGVLTTNTSDVRMKDQIITIESALDKVKQLRGVYYKWKEDLERGVTGNTRVGFIAQEVEGVVPELAFTNERTEDKLMGVHYQDITALLVEAIKELVSSGSPLFNRTELILETQTIAAEDNNIELNFNGTHDSALNGGITVNKGINNEKHSEFVINSDGDWKSNNYILPKGLVIPNFTPTSTNDVNGKIGEITRDDNYLYIKTNDGWKRTGLETF